MNRLPVVLRMAWRETRASRRRLLLFGSAISIGVATLVAIRSFTANVETAVHRQSRELLDADLLIISTAVEKVSRARARFLMVTIPR